MAPTWHIPMPCPQPPPVATISVTRPPARGGLLNSSKFSVRLERSGGGVDAIVAEGGGWGHGIGMCQVGAMGRARAGQDYRTILEAYYPGIRIERMY